jgi:DNA-binding transcriptional LysR family regulator
MQNIGGRQVSSLRISSYNSLAAYVLPDVYRLLLERQPQFGLSIQDMELAAASRSILSGETDLAFTSGIVSDSRLLQIPAFSEPMVLVCAASSHISEPALPQQLSIRDEVYVDWSNRFSQWHMRTLGPAHPQLCVSIMNHLQQFLSQGNRWAIVPVTVAAGLSRELPLKQLKTGFALPRREVSCVVEAQAKLPALDIFFNCLRQVLSTYPEIEILL